MQTPVFRLTLCLTHRCDLACGYCYAGRARSSDMSYPTARQALRYALARLPAGGVLQLGLFGGEPLLAWGLIERLLDELPPLARDRGVTLLPALTTNGTQLTPERCDRLLDAGARVAVSLDGDAPVHDAQRPDHAGQGSFERVTARLTALGQRVSRLSAVMVVTPRTAAELAVGVAALLDLGFRQLELNLDYHAEWPADARELLRAACREAAALYCRRARSGDPFALSWIDTPLSAVLQGGYPPPARCGFGRTEIAVAPSGRVYPCERLIGEDRDGRWALGTLETLRAPTDQRPACCDAGELCIAWCPCNNVVRTGRPDRADDLVHDICQLQLELAAQVADALQLAPLGESHA